MFCAAIVRISIIIQRSLLKLSNKLWKIRYNVPSSTSLVFLKVLAREMMLQIDFLVLRLGHKRRTSSSLLMEEKRISLERYAIDKKVGPSL